MAKNTRSQASLCEMEECLSSRMESRFVELVASMQQTIHEMFQQRQQDSPAASNPPRGERSHPYACGTRLARLEFPRFNGEGIKQWLI